MTDKRGGKNKMGISNIFVSGVFAAGVLSFFSPCIFPLLPVYLGVLLDHDDKRVISIFGKKLQWFGILKTLAFIGGLSTVFITLGYGAGFLGKLLYTDWFRYVTGGIIILLGIHQMELINIRSLQKQKSITYQQKPKRNGLLNAFVLGLTFSFGWTPCVGPVLSSVLGLAASGGEGAVTGGIYMFFYIVGLAIPFLVLAVASTAVMQHFNKIKPHIGLIKKIGGALIVLMGILMMTGSVNAVTAFFENLFRR